MYFQVETTPIETAQPELTEQEALAVLGVKEWDEYPPVETFSFYESPDYLVDMSEEVILEEDEDYMKLVREQKEKEEKKNDGMDKLHTDQNALLS